MGECSLERRVRDLERLVEVLSLSIHGLVGEVSDERGRLDEVVEQLNRVTFELEVGRDGGELSWN